MIIITIRSLKIQKMLLLKIFLNNNFKTKPVSFYYNNNNYFITFVVFKLHSHDGIFKISHEKIQCKIY